MDSGLDLSGSDLSLPNPLEPTSEVLVSYYSSNVLSQSAAVEPVAAMCLHFDFISFLAIAQELKIDFLSITWQPALDVIGGGATAEIRQSLINLQTSFAFKRIRPSTSSQKAKLRAFQALVTEISILGLPRVREHPNIVTIEGICWDVREDEDDEDLVVWPVLVFEKSEFWNLNQYMTTEVGKTMTIQERLYFCSCIASAVAEMHFLSEFFIRESQGYGVLMYVKQDVIHGDIKPQNILVCRDDQNCYVPRVADFGYSTKFADRGSIFLPESIPWTAPEHHHRDFTFIEAKRCDVYSFGLLCLWILFQDKLSETFPIFQGINDSFDAPSNQDGQTSSPRIPEDKNNLLAFAKNVMSTEAEFDTRQKAELEQFFSITLVEEASLRTDNFGTLELLLWRIRKLPPAAIIEIKNTEVPVPHADFQILKSLLFLIDTHYLVRRHIKTCLESYYNSSGCEKCIFNAAFQLAICYDIGFGVPRSVERSLSWLEKSGSSISQLEAEKGQAIRPQWQYNSESLRLLDQRGHLRRIDCVADYRKTEVLESALIECRREIDDTIEGLGADNISTKSLKLNLVELLEARGDFEAGEKILVQLSGRNESGHEDDDDDFLDIQNRLAISLHRQGKNKAAAEILKQDIRKKERIYGKGHPPILSSMNTLSRVYSGLGMLKASEELQRQALEEYERSLGPDHPEVLVMVGNLAATLVEQGRYLEAEEMELYVLKGREKMLGVEHQDTLMAMNNLAVSHLGRCKYKEAEEINRMVLERRERVLGKTHMDTLASLDNLASTLHYLGQYEAAKDMHQEALDGRAILFGPEHPVTLVSQAGVAGSLASLGKYEEAEALYQQTVQTSERVLGMKHKDTLGRSIELASVLQRLGKSEAAEGMHERALQGTRQLLGEKHPTCISAANNLALDLQRREKYSEAEDMFQQILEVSKAEFGSAHLTTLAIMSNLGLAIRAQRKFEAADLINREVLEATEQLLGPHHPTTLTSVQNLAQSLHLQGRHVEAVPFYMMACGGLRDVLGDDHPQTLECFRRYFDMLNVMTQEEIDMSP